MNSSSCVGACGSGFGVEGEGSGGAGRASDLRVAYSSGNSTSDRDCIGRCNYGEALDGNHVCSHSPNEESNGVEYAFRMIALAVQQLQQAMCAVELKMEKTHSAVINIAERLTELGQKMQRLEKCMETIERKVMNCVQQRQKRYEIANSIANDISADSRPSSPISFSAQSTSLTSVAICPTCGSPTQPCSHSGGVGTEKSTADQATETEIEISAERTTSSSSRPLNSPSRSPEISCDPSPVASASCMSQQSSPSVFKPSLVCRLPRRLPWSLVQQAAV